ncbi:MAG: hypothetical protein OHK0017_11750 [Patescibacteria group bacterium]
MSRFKLSFNFVHALLLILTPIVAIISYLIIQYFREYIFFSRYNFYLYSSIFYLVVVIFSLLLIVFAYARSEYPSILFMKNQDLDERQLLVKMKIQNIVYSLLFYAVFTLVLALVVFIQLMRMKLWFFGYYPNLSSIKLSQVDELVITNWPFFIEIALFFVSLPFAVALLKDKSNQKFGNYNFRPLVQSLGRTIGTITLIALVLLTPTYIYAAQTDEITSGTNLDKVAGISVLGMQEIEIEIDSTIQYSRISNEGTRWMLARLEFQPEYLNYRNPDSKAVYNFTSPVKKSFSGLI